LIIWECADLGIQNSNCFNYQITKSSNYQIELMNKFSVFVKESYTEMMEKVSWPKWDQLTQSTMIVLGATIFITALGWVMDVIANASMNFIYSLFKH